MATTIPSTRKRSLDEVVPPSFVAREDEGGAYGALEMPKRIVLNCVADKDRYVDDRIRALEVENAQIYAESNRLISRRNVIIRTLRAENAARAAAAATPRPPSASSSA